jgi:hypothetical protein
LWRGDVSLPKSYWLFGCLGGVAIRLLSPVIIYGVTSHAASMSNFDIQILIGAWFVLATLYSGFVLVAIWRSANKYRARFHSVYATLAQAACVFGALVLIGSIGEYFNSSSKDLTTLASGGGTADDRLQYEAIIAGLNANLPRNIDSVTTLTRIGIDKTGFQYFETIAADVDSNDAFIQRMRPAMARSLCKDTAVKDNMSQGLNYQYVYVDKNGKPIGNLLMSISDCAKAN